MGCILKIVIIFSFLVNICLKDMKTFIQGKVFYRCPCLMHLVNEISSKNIRSYLAILETISSSCVTPEQFFSLHDENKTSCMIMCQAHLILTLLLETNYECASESDNVFFVILYKDVPTGTRRPRDAPWRSPKGPNVRDIQGIFRGLLEDQHKTW